MSISEKTDERGSYDHAIKSEAVFLIFKGQCALAEDKLEIAEAALLNAITKINDLQRTRG